MPSGTRRYLPPALLLGALIGPAGCQPPGPQAVELPPIEVPVAAPLERQIVDAEEYTGKVGAVERVSVMARVDGYLTEIRFQPGQLVKKGDVLFVIDKRPYQAALDIAKGQLAQAEARATRLTKEHVRFQQLLASNAGSREEYDKVVGDLAEAQAGVLAAKAGVDQAKLNLDFAEVVAPIDGRVGRQLVTVGNLVQGSMASTATVLTDIVSVDQVYVYFDTPERDALHYRRTVQAWQRAGAGDEKIPVEVGLFDEAGYPHAGVIDYFPERVDAGTGTQTLRAVLPNPGRSLLADGMFARVRVAFTKAYPGLAVADRAVVTLQGDKFLFIVNDQNAVEERPVELGRLIAPGLRHVRAGLKPGDRVAVSNLQRLMPGAKVVPVPVAMPLPPAK
jgi:membrane fusion protein, multidrug efflux system